MTRPPVLTVPGLPRERPDRSLALAAECRGGRALGRVDVSRVQVLNGGDHDHVVDS